MKIFSAVIGLAAVEAGKGGRGGKHGNVNMDNERFNWKIPKCIANDALCQSDSTETASEGVISLGEDRLNDYTNFRNVLHRIELGASRTIQLKFNMTEGFEMEYHKNCGYDKVHIFSGLVDQFDDAQRIARFCGPKKEGGKPWDGSRILKNSNGVLPMWDTWYETNSGNVVIGIDLDQDRDDFRGFNLMWRSEPTSIPDFSKFSNVVRYGIQMVKEDTLKSLNIMDKKRVALNKEVEAFRKRMIQRSDDKPRKCQRNFNSRVPTKFQAAFKQYWGDGTSSIRWETTLEALGMVMQYYVHECPTAVQKKWIGKDQGENLHNLFKRRRLFDCSNGDNHRFCS